MRLTHDLGAKIDGSTQMCASLGDQFPRNSKSCVPSGAFFGIVHKAIHNFAYLSVADNSYRIVSICCTVLLSLLIILFFVIQSASAAYVLSQNLIIKKIIITTKAAVAMHCNLKATLRRATPAFGQISTAHVQKLVFPSFRSKF